MKYSKLSGLGDMLSAKLHLIISFSDVNGYPLPAYRLNPWKDWGELAYKFQEEHFRLECVPSTSHFWAGNSPTSQICARPCRGLFSGCAYASAISQSNALPRTVERECAAVCIYLRQQFLGLGRKCGGDVTSSADGDRRCVGS
jgi:hypothetical protein